VQQDPEELLFLLEPVVLADLVVFPFEAFHRIVPEAWALGLLEIFLAFWAFPLVLDLDCWIDGFPFVLDLH
jgi:hypothetical protein